MAEPVFDPLPRLRGAAARIRALAPTFGDRLTDADEASGERWERGQVLSHVAEFLPFWTQQVELIVASGGHGTPFGRVKGSPERLQRIETGRHASTEELLARMDQGVDEVAALLARLRPDELELTGRHQTRGEMTVAAAIDEFFVRHLEEHAAQLAAG